MNPMILKSTTMIGVASEIIADLTAKPPTSVSEARAKLTDLLAAIRGSLEETWARTQPFDNQPADTRAALPDYQAILAEIGTRVEAVEALVIAITDLNKAEAAAAATLDKVMKRLHAPRIEARVWDKLRPVITMGVDVGTGDATVTTQIHDATS